MALAELRFAEQIGVRVRPPVAAYLAGVPLPLQPNRVASMRSVRTLWLGPDEWLVTAPAGAAPDLMGRITRALANRPQVVLADEPTGNLDSEATLDVLRLFESLHEAGQTLVIVTHDSRIAATADRLISMRDGAFIDETRLTGGTSGQLGALLNLDG